MYAFVAKTSPITNRIVLSSLISPHKVTHGIKVNALWDTGATSSCIGKSLMQQLNMNPIAFTDVSHAGGRTNRVPVYLLDVILPNNVRITGVHACQFDDAPDANFIIGMDIITLGDFAITNLNNETTISFRIPSTQTIDFTKPAQPVTPSPKQIIASPTPKNVPCKCGSGKKYKHCCGK